VIINYLLIGVAVAALLTSLAGTWAAPPRVDPVKNLTAALVTVSLVVVLWPAFLGMALRNRYGRYK